MKPQTIEQVVRPEEFEAFLKEMPRLFYYGHSVVKTIDQKNARWECRNCKHQWESEDGTTCPQCQTLILS